LYVIGASPASDKSDNDEIESRRSNRFRLFIDANLAFKDNTGEKQAWQAPVLRYLNV